MAAAIGLSGDGGAACRRAWLKSVNVHSPVAHERNMALVARRGAGAGQGNRLTNQVRGLVKPFGLLVGKVDNWQTLAAPLEPMTIDLAA